MTEKLPSKAALRDELVRLLEADLATLERAQQATLEGATHEEAKPENDKDTRALEQSYLARGQAARVEELHRNVAEVRRMPIGELGESTTVVIGALVTIEEDDTRTILFVALHGGGSRLANGAVQVVTPKS